MPVTPRKTGTAAKRKPAARKTTTRKVAPPVEAQAPIIVEPTPEERQAKLTAYSALTNAGLPVPADLKAEVDGWIAAEQARQEAEVVQAAEIQAAQQEVDAKGGWYVRNLTNVPFSLRLDRQTEKRRLELKPRGMPSDLHPLEDDDRKDVNLVRNVRLGAIEVIPARVAEEIMDKQTYNMGPRVHTPTALLRNPTGQPYAEGAIKVEAEFNNRGVTVATLDPAQMQGHVTDKEVASNRTFGGLQRTAPGEVPSKVSEFIPTGGNQASITVPAASHLGQNAQAKIADDLARRKGVGGVGAGLGGLQVTVAPTVKE